MSSSQLIRWSGLAAMAAGVSLVIAELLSLLFFGYDFSNTATTDTYTFYSVWIMIAGLLLPLGLVGLYARQLEASGLLGLVGFVVAFIGTVLVAGFFWTSAFITPLLSKLPTVSRCWSSSRGSSGRSLCLPVVGCYSG